MSDLHVLTHATRMLITLIETPKHPRKKEYEKQLVIYRAKWLALPRDVRVKLASEAKQFPDLTPKAIAAAVAALEG